MTDSLPLEALDAVDEFVSEIHDESVSEHDRFLHSSHPLAILIESALEAISTYALSAPIVGLSRTAEDQLVSERRTLERQGGKEALQLLLFAFEPLCQFVREAGYASWDREGASLFFEQAFPDWLEALEAWATEDNDVPLAERVSEVRRRYMEVAYLVVVAA